MVESGVIELVCRMRADLSVPIGGGTFRSWFALFDFAWPKEGGAEAADRGEEAPEETDGGDSPVGLEVTLCEGGLKPGALELS